MISEKMTDPTKMTRISQVATVFVPVADQERALEFYLDMLGFEKRADFTYGEASRWIEVAPPGSQSRWFRRARASPTAATRLIAR